MTTRTDALPTQEMTINMGPQHPSTHGVLRVILTTDGEVVTRAVPDMGYLHRGLEKIGERVTYAQYMPFTDRLDYLAAMNCNCAWAWAVEKLAKIEVPERAEYLRVIVCELNRISSHLIAFGSYTADMGAFTPFLYAIRERERVNDLFEMICGNRLTYNYARVGGVSGDAPPGFLDKTKEFLDYFEPKLDEYNNLISYNKIFVHRLANVAVIPAEEAVAYGLTGPNLRGSGLNWDIRKNEPYLFYDQVEFDVPVYEQGDCDARARVRIDEMRESLRIAEQSLDKIEQLAGEPWISDDRKVVLPPREELQTSMESLIHHFKIVSEGYRVPAGEVYVAIEGPRGEEGCYVVSDGGAKPWRVHFRAPSFLAIAAAPTLCQEHLIADLIAISASLDTLMGDSDR